jgi:hypothetical protein
VRQYERLPNDGADVEFYDGCRPKAGFWSFLDSKTKGAKLMQEVFRKHYSYGETIPIIDTHVAMIADIYEVTGKPSQQGPVIKAVCVATAGPMKSLPLVLEPLQSSDSKVVHLTNIPVPIAWVRTIDIALMFDFANYRWTPSPETPHDNGIVTFDLRLRAAFSVLGKSYTLQLDQRPCSITLTKTLPQLQPQTAGVGQGMQQYGGQPTSGQSEYGSVSYGQQEQQRFVQPTINGGGNEPTTLITNQLDVEERLRQLGTKLLSRA